MATSAALPLPAGNRVVAVDWTATGGTCVYTANDRRAHLWAPGDTAPLDLAGHAGNVTGVAVDPGGALALSVGAPGPVLVWDATDGRPMRTLGAVDAGTHPLPFHSVATDGQRAAATTVTGAVQVWDVASGALSSSTGPVAVGDVALAANARAAFGPSGHLAVWSTDSCYRLWDVSGTLMYTVGGETRAGALGASRVTDLVVTGDGQVVSSVYGTVRVRDATGQVTQEPTSAANLGALALTEDGRVLCAASGWVFAWSMTDGRWAGGVPDPAPGLPDPLALHVTSSGALIVVRPDGTVTTHDLDAELENVEPPRPPGPASRRRSRVGRVRDALDGRRMTAEKFWDLISESRARAESSGGTAVNRAERQADVLAELLRTRTAGEVLAFHRTFHRLVAQSDTADLLDVAALLGPGSSDDGYEYFRAWLVGQGRTYFDTALRDPERAADRISTLEDGADAENQALGEAAASVYEDLTGSPVPHDGAAPSPRRASPPPDGPELDPADRFPRLYRRLHT